MSYLVTVMLLALAAGDEVPHFEAEQIFPPVKHKRMRRASSKRRRAS